ncbi:MAG: hypothetical protein ACOC3C_04130 [Candidatus Thorarchaeota archaeon]
MVDKNAIAYTKELIEKGNFDQDIASVMADRSEEVAEAIRKAVVNGDFRELERQWEEMVDESAEAIADRLLTSDG